MNTKKQPFVFEFFNEETEKYNLYYFYISSDDDLLNLSLSEEFSNFISDNEDYGVHDVSCHDPFFCGYMSYEVEESNQDIVFENIKRFFINKGYNCSETITYKNSEDIQACEDEFLKNIGFSQENNQSMS